MAAEFAPPTSALGRWASVTRLPFTSVAVAPFAAGSYMAYAHGRLVSPLAAVAGIVAVFLITLACYLLGEIFDQQEDLATLQYQRSRFSGGSLLVATGVLSKRAVGAAAVACLAGALVLGVLIVSIHRDLLLLGLGAIGAAAAVCYSVPPVRLVQRGVGELFIGFCYGWLTIATGYACASGELPPRSWLLALPSTLTVFNVILLNEFQDYEADRSTGKRNLLQRVGRPAGAAIYSLAALGSAAGLVALWALRREARWELLLYLAPAVLLALYVAAAVGLRGLWRDHRRLEPICGLTIVLCLAAAV